MKLKNLYRHPGWILVTDKNSHWIRMADGPTHKNCLGICNPDHPRRGLRYSFCHNYDYYDYEFQVYNKLGDTVGILSCFIMFYIFWF